MSLTEIIDSLRLSINGVANPTNATEDKIDEIENALRDILSAFEALQDGLRRTAQ